MNTTSMDADMMNMNGHTTHANEASTMDAGMMHGGGHAAHPDDPGKAKGHQALLDLVPSSQVTHKAVNNGSWFDPNTWEGGKIPGNGAHVMIEEGVKVYYNQESNARLKTVRVDGHLTFAHNQNTKMVVDTFVETPTGTLDIGTPVNPIQADKTAQIIIANNGNIDTRWDPTQLSRGLITHGKVAIHGAEKTDFIALAKDVEAGDSELVLKGKPTGWQVGDKLVLGGTDYRYNGDDEDNSRFQDEVLTITEINGDRVRFTNDDITEGDNTVLRFDHSRPDIAEKDQLQLYVANTSRNVTIASEYGEDTPTNQRGHVMFMHNPDVDVQNAGFYHLGRSDKTRMVDDVGSNVDGSKGYGTNPRGRYALHVHRAGADIDGQAAVLEGNAVVGSPGWGIVHHDSHAVIRDNVVFDVAGAGISAESGNEIGLWENNITIKTTGLYWADIAKQRDARERKFDFGFQGEGYWVQGAAQVAMRDNVAVSANDAGITIFGDGLNPDEEFRDKGTIEVKNLPADIRNKVAKPGQKEVDVTDVPLRELSGFESYNTSFGMEIWAQMTNFDGQFEFDSPDPQTAHDLRGTVEDFKLWGSRWAGLNVSYSSNLDFKDGLIVGDVEKPSGGQGLFHNHATFNTHYDNLTVKGFKEGLEVELLNTEKSFTRSSIANSNFSDNTYNLKKVTEKGSHDDFPSAFGIKDTTFESKEGNKAPVAKFGEKAAGGLSVSFNAAASYDSDPHSPEGTFGKYPIDSKGIAAYAWDFDSDGKIDDFGRQATHQFDRAGTHDVTLQVLDSHGQAQTLTKTLQVKPTAYPNAFKDGSFGTPGPFLKPRQSNSRWSDQGWFGTQLTKRANGTAVLSDGKAWNGTLGQVVENNQLHQGQQTLSFRLKNVEGNDQPWGNNEVVVQLWGVDGQFNNEYWEDGPTQVGNLPMSRQLLHEETYVGESGQSSNWQTLNADVDLGDGYEFLVAQFQIEKGNDPGDFIAIDDVQLRGEAPATPITNSPGQPVSPPIPTPEPTPLPTPVPSLPAPIASLTFNEQGGPIAYDSSTQGSNNLGTLIGNTKRISGIKDQAVILDGRGDAVYIEDAQDINLGTHNERTLSMWFKADSTNRKQVLYEEGSTVRGLNTYIQGDQLYVGGWNQSESESSWEGTWLSTDVVAGEWNHVALVLDGDKQVAAGAIEGYLNGESFGTGEGSQLWGRAGDIGIGINRGGTRFHDGATWGTSQGFAGEIDEVAIFNDALSSSQVESLATAV